MNKAASLRKALGDAVPALRRDPDKLLVFSDAGSIAATNTKTLSFEYRYQLNLILTDFTGNPDDIMLALLGWVSINQPDLIENRDKRATGITFEVDHLKNDACDLSLKVNLTEAVKVTVDADGVRTVTHPPEEIPEWRHLGKLTVD